MPHHRAEAGPTFGCPTLRRAFAVIDEYRLAFAIAVDRPSPDGDIPLTMRAHGFRGTPSLVLINRQGSVQAHEFGQVDELASTAPSTND